MPGTIAQVSIVIEDILAMNVINTAFVVAIKAIVRDLARVYPQLSGQVRVVRILATANIGDDDLSSAALDGPSRWCLDLNKAPLPGVDGTRRYAGLLQGQSG